MVFYNNKRLPSIGLVQDKIQVAETELVTIMLQLADLTRAITKKIILTLS